MSVRYLLMDESGDPGLDTDFFIAGTVEVSREALKDLRRLLAPYTHHYHLYNENKAAGLSATGRPRLKACEILCAILDRDDTHASVVYVEKDRYTGPYLGKQGKPVVPAKFRNFVTRLLLEHHFQGRNIPTDTQIELVFDRVSMSRAVRQNLESYLSGNFRLPTIHHYTHVDSEYADPIFMPDLAVTVVKEYLRGDPETLEALAVMAALNCLDVSAP